MQRVKTRQQGNRVDTIVVATFLLCTSLLLLYAFRLAQMLSFVFHNVTFPWFVLSFLIGALEKSL